MASPTTITAVMSRVLDVPLPAPFRPAWGRGEVQSSYFMTLIEVHTDAGLVGITAAEARSETAVALERFVAPHLIGRDGAAPGFGRPPPVELPHRGRGRARARTPRRRLAGGAATATRLRRPAPAARQAGHAPSGGRREQPRRARVQAAARPRVLRRPPAGRGAVRRRLSDAQDCGTGRGRGPAHRAPHLDPRDRPARQPPAGRLRAEYVLVRV